MIKCKNNSYTCNGQAEEVRPRKKESKKKRKKSLQDSFSETDGVCFLSRLLHKYDQPRGLAVTVSAYSIPGSTVGIFPEGEDSRGDHGLGRLVEFRFKGPPGTTSSYITTHIIKTT